ncbi:MAG: SDR family oxidoreductase [Acidimicrobiales bacterium]|nr:SDR family oxidoreductase [Acidimicrobiales bacterium]
MEGARALVTGASSGIGAATAVALAEHGATVGLVGRRRDKLEDVLAQCRVHTPDSHAWVADLGDLSRAETLIHDAWAEFGALDLLVNNAAVPKRRHVSDLTPAEIEDVMRVNFLSPVRMSLAVLPRFLERGSGMIVNVSSTGGRLGILHEAAYCASKFALCGWSESMALDLWGTGVEIRLVIPGAFATDIWNRPDNEPSPYDGPLEDPVVAAAAILGAIEGTAFETYVPAEMKSVAEFKTAAIDAFLAGTIAAMGGSPPTENVHPGGVEPDATPA